MHNSFFLRPALLALPPPSSGLRYKLRYSSEHKEWMDGGRLKNLTSKSSGIKTIKALSHLIVAAASRIPMTIADWMQRNAPPNSQPPPPARTKRSHSSAESLSPAIWTLIRTRLHIIHMCCCGCLFLLCACSHCVQARRVYVCGSEKVAQRAISGLCSSP